MKTFFDGAHCQLACLLKGLTFKALVFVQLKGITFQLETRIFLFVTSELLLLEFCPIKLFCQQREQPTITNIKKSLEGPVIYYQLSHHDFVISTIISIWVCVSLTLHRNIEDLLNLVIQFDELRFPSPFNFFLTLFELIGKENLKPVSTIFCEIFIFSPNDSPSKTMKNFFYFI